MGGFRTSGCGRKPSPALTFIEVVDDSDKSVLSLWLAVIGCTLLPCDGCENSGGYAAVLMQKMLS
jgi:hypothetical protein